ncbi:NAD-dependent epimerase/dehydratase family protein [Tamlana flava]|uniref:NAD-dependent epimerase/dehydratase family protein n=1 Tax=Tamlana flava TaxID=3158572 RepID=UPI00351ACF40
MKKYSKILVTGANGLLGTNTIMELLKQGFMVRGFLRNRNNFVGPTHQNLELFEGDITKVNHLNEALRDIDCVIHTAAITGQHILDYKDYYKVNVEGVENLVFASIKNKVRRIVYVSTAGQFGYGTLEDLGNESIEIKQPFKKQFYVKSKKEAYDFLQTIKNEIDVVTVNPSFMIGAYDSKPSSGKIVLMGIRNRLVFCPPGGKSFVCVQDVSRGAVNAMIHGNSGESYLLANENLSFEQFFKRLRKLSKNNMIIIKIPKLIMISLGYFGDFLRYLKIPIQLSTANIRLLCVNGFYSNTKAKNELGVQFSPIENGILDAVHWFSKHRS